MEKNQFMKKIARMVVTIGFALLLTVLQANNKAQAAELPSDGTYTASYTVLENGSSSASIANDYFDKPATITAKDGKYTVQLQLNHSKWITAFSAGSGNSTLSSDTAADTRVVQFTVSSLAQAFDASIKVDIDDNDMDYHHSYTIQLSFDLTSAALVSSTASATTSAATDTATSSSTATSTQSSSVTSSASVANPNTGAGDYRTTYVAVLAISGALLSGLAVYKKMKI
jgi:heme uptake protein IsdC